MPNILWPALLKLHGDDELLYIASQQAWNTDINLRNSISQPGDVIIDSKGARYKINAADTDILVAMPDSQTMALDSILELIKLHQSQLGACCAAKLYFPTIAAAVLSLKDNP